MLVCAVCNQALRPKKNGVAFVELAGDNPYKLWMADLWECQGCGTQILYTDNKQTPISESFHDNFLEKVAAWAPAFQAKEWNRP